MCFRSRTLSTMNQEVYEKKGPTKVAYLREERVARVPKSFSKLDLFLKERRVELEDFLLETTEVAAPEGRQHMDEPMEGEAEDSEVEAEDSEGEMGSEEHFGDSADEDLSDLDEEEEQ